MDDREEFRGLTVRRGFLLLPPVLLNTNSVLSPLLLNSTRHLPPHSAHSTPSGSLPHNSSPSSAQSPQSSTSANSPSRSPPLAPPPLPPPLPPTSPPAPRSKRPLSFSASLPTRSPTRSCGRRLRQGGSGSPKRGTGVRWWMSWRRSARRCMRRTLGAWLRGSMGAWEVEDEGGRREGERGRREGRRRRLLECWISPGLRSLRRTGSSSCVSTIRTRCVSLFPPSLPIDIKLTIILPSCPPPSSRRNSNNSSTTTCSSSSKKSTPARTFAGTLSTLDSSFNRRST